MILLEIGEKTARLFNMSDSIQTLTEEICHFRDQRDWKQFHNPKEMAVALTAEVGELLQHFVWQNPDQSNRRIMERKKEISEEMADVAILLFEMAELCDVNLAKAMRAKLVRNAEKYPVEKSKGSNKKYNEL